MLCCQNRLCNQLMSSEPNTRHKSHRKPSTMRFSCFRISVTSHLSLRRARLRQLALRQLSHMQLRLRQLPGCRSEAGCARAHIMARTQVILLRQVSSCPPTTDVLHFWLACKLLVISLYLLGCLLNLWSCTCSCQVQTFHKML